MSCVGDSQIFRLLDGFIGWDEDDATGLTGYQFDDAEGLRLALVDPDAVSAAVVLAYLPPPQLAHGCGRCDWFLANKSQFLRRDCCAPNWFSAWSRACEQHPLMSAIAVAARGHRVAVADDEAKRVWIWERDGEQLVAAINTNDLADVDCSESLDSPNSISRPGALAFTPWGELLVADLKTNAIWRFGPSGEVRGTLPIASPPTAEGEYIDRLAVSDNCSIWLVTRTRDSSLKLWRARTGDPEFKKATVDELQKAFKATGLTAASDQGFCLEECGPEGLPVPRCFGWDGECLPTVIEPPVRPSRNEQGQLLTQALDSGIPRCRWHRVRLEADVPTGTSVEVSVATSETEEAPAQGDGKQEGGWKKFPAGVPHHLDWQVAPAGSLDFLVTQPPGRFLFVRIRLKGDTKTTPVVRRLRLDFPRVTSLDYLPGVYRDNPEAEDFSERFLALFDAAISDLDRAIERAPALLDPQGVPDDVLPWLGSFLDLAFDPAWNADLRREILRSLPKLYRLRGTAAGIVDTVKLIFGVEPAIQEMATERNWASLARNNGSSVGNRSQLGATRLFGRSKARFRLNSSPLGQAPVRSYGNADHDPLLAQAFRLRVLVPPLSTDSPIERDRLERLIVSQKPAHTVAAIRFGGTGFVLGNTSAVGVDTVIAPLPPPVLGEGGNVRLHRMSVLWHGDRGRRKGTLLGESTVLGERAIAA